MSNITTILKRFGMLDAEDYLVPPENPRVYELVMNIVRLRSIVEEGKQLTPQQKIDLKEMETAKDYYDEALEEELEALRAAGHRDEEDEDEDFIDDSPEGAQPGAADDEEEEEDLEEDDDDEN